jgi:cytochrome c oxidase subunit II
MNRQRKQRKFSSILILLLIVPMLILSGCGSRADVDLNTIKAQKLIEYHSDKYKDEKATGELIDGVRHINIKAYQFYFEPTTIIVNKGEKIKLTIEAMDIPHGFEIEGFEIPDYDINTKIRPGFPLEVEFLADEIGVWEFICSIYCGFGHSVMKGTFVVR